MRGIIALTLLVVSVQTAAAQLTADKFKSAVEKKVAPPFGTLGSGKWKALCVCNTNDRVGAVESFNGNPNLNVTCTVPTFDGAGDYTFGFACYDWTPLTK
jgi:hypothetical protein